MRGRKRREEGRVDTAAFKCSYPLLGYQTNVVMYSVIMKCTKSVVYTIVYPSKSSEIKCRSDILRENMHPW